MSRSPAHFLRRSVLRGTLAASAALGLAGVGRAATAASRGAAVPALRVGGYEVMALVDATGPFFLPASEAFPGTGDAAWAAARRIDPEAFGDDGVWVLDFRCFVIRRPGGSLAVVDTGVGPASSPAAAWAPVPGRLPRALREAGLDPRDVDTVVLTHLHDDHYGWTRGEDGDPFFPDARHLVQQRELDGLAPDSAAHAYVVGPLRAAGLLAPVDGGCRLWRRAGTVSLLPTPGHTPGHQSVVVAGADTEVVLTGDVLVHAVQLADPDVAYRYEADPDTARATRTALLTRAREHRAWLGNPHLRRPFVRA
ncbi:MBL fold metallo-hydrolase [Streptomyces sp. A7024]|uniref:MBL fold metallo-hydrolase n=1 Tax=Streptomyces coryli TaxID=1128680 RepID=A0A6G4TUR5_9ACTN|nr:MBL fold metallo-hydrolase [Streptomyces coryli]NGN63512.1 MBL fold metallo-hydrolase [Streptomyces coryli]